MGRRIAAHLVLVLVGLAAVVWALTAGMSPTIECRGVPMGPGDVCTNAQGTKQQTYEERWQAARDSVPIVTGVGVLLAGFGVALVVGERRRAA